MRANIGRPARLFAARVYVPNLFHVKQRYRLV